MEHISFDISSIHIFSAIFVFLVSLKVVKWWKDPMRKIPGPPGLPLLGNTIEMITDDNVHEMRLKLARKYGKIYKNRFIFGKWRKMRSK